MVTIAINGKATKDGEGINAGAINIGNVIATGVDIAVIIMATHTLTTITHHTRTTVIIVHTVVEAAVLTGTVAVRQDGDTAETIVVA